MATPEGKDFEWYLCIGRRRTKDNKIVTAYIQLDKDLKPLPTYTEDGELGSRFTHWKGKAPWGISTVVGAITCLMGGQSEYAGKWKDTDKILEWQFEDEIVTSRQRLEKKSKEDETDYIDRALSPILKAMRSTDSIGARLIMMEVMKRLYRCLFTR